MKKESQLTWCMWLIGCMVIIILGFWGNIMLIKEGAWLYLPVGLIFLIFGIWYFITVLKRPHDNEISLYLKNFKSNWEKKSLSVKIIEIVFWLIVLFILLMLILPFFE